MLKTGSFHLTVHPKTSAKLIYNVHCFCFSHRNSILWEHGHHRRRTYYYSLTLFFNIYKLGSDCVWVYGLPSLCCAAKPFYFCKCGYTDTENGKHNILIFSILRYRTQRHFTACLKLFLTNRNKSLGFNSVCICSERFYIMKLKRRYPWI